MKYDKGTFGTICLICLEDLLAGSQANRVKYKILRINEDFGVDFFFASETN